MLNLTYKEFKLLSEYIYHNYGIKLKDEKQALLSGRLQNVLMQMEYDSFTSFYEHLINDKTGKTGQLLIDRISTNHTFFMREASHFKFFQEHVLPSMKLHIHNKDLRVWCAACSSGEEAYTLAMIIDEVLGFEKSQWDAKLLATDISEAVLSKAVQGIYQKQQINSLPVAWKNRYFHKQDEDTYIANDELKKSIIFRKFNLMDKTFPFKRKFHTIFCRNVMIYFDTPTKDILTMKMYDLLEHGGYLFVGHSENVNRELTNFQSVCPSVYRKP